MNDLLSFSEELHGLLIERPGEYLSIFESAALEVAQQVTSTTNKNDVTGGGRGGREIQIQLINYPRLTQIRNLQSDHVGKVGTIDMQCTHTHAYKHALAYGTRD